MLMLKSTCGINLHQYVIGNVGGNYATVDFMHDLYFWIALSDGFFCACLEVYTVLLFFGLQRSPQHTLTFRYPFCVIVA